MANDDTHRNHNDAVQALNQIATHFKHLKPSPRVYLQDLVSDLVEAEESFDQAYLQTKHERPKHPGSLEVLNKILFINSYDQQNFIKNNGFRPRDLTVAQTSALDRDVAQLSREIAKWFHEESIEKKSELGAPAADDNGRKPNSSRVEPSVGPQGNIFGTSFPSGVWALTFDDGPSSHYTPEILDNLAKHNVKTTFFWLAMNTRLSSSGALIDRAKRDGHKLECHSYTHPDLSRANATKLQHEIVDAWTEEKREYAEPIPFFRCPYGSCLHTQAARKLIADNGMIHVFWNVDSLDWQDKNPDSVVARVRKQMALVKHGIILFHDIHPQSVVASEVIMRDLTSAEKGLKPMTIPAVVDLMNGQAQ
jgi:peptidoglycan/xylan/chitin deacetylase (PgdA/CDA1 family)